MLISFRALALTTVFLSPLPGPHKKDWEHGRELVTVPFGK